LGLNWNSALETGGVLVSESSFEYRINFATIILNKSAQMAKNYF
jgi:hypothetical protein